MLRGRVEVMFGRGGAGVDAFDNKLLTWSALVLFVTGAQIELFDAKKMATKRPSEVLIDTYCRFKVSAEKLNDHADLSETTQFDVNMYVLQSQYR